MSARPKAFISYKRDVRPDEQLARALYRRLVDAGIEAFLDEPEISVGDRWEVKIASALEECQHFVLLVSDDSVKSDMVWEELRRAHIGGKKHSVHLDRRPGRASLRIRSSLESVAASAMEGVRRLRGDR